MALLELYLVRHAIAAERGPDFPDDDKRPLTSEGEDSFRRAADGLVQLGVALDVILTSPLVRTRQTADILAKALPDRPPVVMVDALAPSGSTAAVFQAIAKHQRKPSMALVGHEPNIGELAARLIAAKSAIPFKKGAVCRIDLDDLPPKGCGELRWFLPPRILRKLA